MKNMLIATLLLLTLSACQHAPDDDAHNRVLIANGIMLPLALPNSSFTTTQKVTAQYRDTQHTLLMQVQTSPQSLVMAGLAPSGTRLFSLRFDGHAVETWQSPLFSLAQFSASTFDVRYVLADFELTAFDHIELQKKLPRDALLTDTIDPQGVRVRELQRRNGDVVIHIEYRNTQTQYCHRERHYCLHIETLP